MADLVVPWRLNLAIAASALAADAWCLHASAHASAWWGVALAAIGFSFANHALFALDHEAVHGVALPWPRANDLLGSVLCATFPQSFCLQRAFHLSHHRLNRTDSELFDEIRPGDVAWLKRWLWYGILLGEYWLRVPVAMLLWLPGPWPLRRPLLRDPRRAAVRSWSGWRMIEALDRVPPLRSRLEILWAVAAHALAWRALGLTPTAWLACYGAFALNWGSVQYTVHAFSERSVRDGAWDLRAPWPLRLAVLNYHLHRAHHREPHRPWTRLPDAVDESRPRPRFLAQYLAMWRGPRRVDGGAPEPEPESWEAVAPAIRPAGAAAPGA